VWYARRDDSLTLLPAGLPSALSRTGAAQRFASLTTEGRPLVRPLPPAGAFFSWSSPITTALVDAVGAATTTVRRAIETYPGRVALSCSFGGASGMVLLDIALGVEPALPVFLVDTEVLFPETYALVERVEHRYGITVLRARPAQTIVEQNATYGDALWTRDPDACCALRKVEPLRAFLTPYDAWLTAIRRDQSATRTAIAGVTYDAANDVVKIAPLVDWTEDDVWSYVADNDVPVNTLHFDGYPSIGCTHCTRRVAPGEHARAGRWAGFDKTECGIHVA
jgi:phosphoadenosine phosphosulfate reductase